MTDLADKLHKHRKRMERFNYDTSLLQYKEPMKPT